MIAPSVSDRTFIFVIAVASVVMAAIFGWITATNRKAGEEARKEKKVAKAAKKASAESLVENTEESTEQLLLPEKNTEEEK